MGDIEGTDRHSPNFDFLEQYDPNLALSGLEAESYALSDPHASLLKARVFGETLAKHLVKLTRIQTSETTTQKGRLQALAVAGVLTPEVEEAFHAIRRAGNQAAHGHTRDAELAISILRHCFELGLWLHLAVNKDAEFRSFVPPQALGARSHDKTEAVERLRERLYDYDSKQTFLALTGTRNWEYEIPAEPQDEVVESPRLPEQRSSEPDEASHKAAPAQAGSNGESLPRAPKKGPPFPKTPITLLVAALLETSLLVIAYTAVSGALATLAIVLVFELLGLGTLLRIYPEFDEEPYGLTPGRKFASRAALVGAALVNPFSLTVIAVIVIIINAVSELSDILSGLT